MSIKSIKTGWTGISASVGAYKFDPKSISGLTLWLDASVDSSFTFSSGTRVSQWNDLSGNGYHFTQSTTTNQPDRNVTQNGKSSVKMKASTTTYWMQNTAFEWAFRPFTVLAVARFNVGSYSALLSTNALAEFQIGIDASNPAKLAISRIGQATTASNLTQANTTTSQITYKSAGFQPATNDVTVQIYQNGTAASGTVNISSVGFPTSKSAIGATQDGSADSFGADGFISEIIVYEKELSDGERLFAEEYLKTKWGL